MIHLHNIIPAIVNAADNPSEKQKDMGCGQILLRWVVGGIVGLLAGTLITIGIVVLFLMIIL